MCPKLMPLGQFRDNAAHSNLRYGLRIFPEYYPNSEPCRPMDGSSVPAIFEGFRGYKNGMKGAIATQTTGAAHPIPQLPPRHPVWQAGDETRTPAALALDPSATLPRCDIQGLPHRR